MAALIADGAPGAPSFLRRRAARVGAVLAVTGELVVDKLPQTPSRLSPVGLGARLVMATVASVLLARGAKRPWLPAVLVACGAALFSAKVGHDARVAAGEHAPPVVPAAVEDVIALGLAKAATNAG